MERNLLLGSNAVAGEIGHHQIRATDGFYCNCGKIGCFEAKASATGSVRHALAVAHSFPNSALVHALDEKLTSKGVVTAVRPAISTGSPPGISIWTISRVAANVITFGIRRRSRSEA